MSGCLSLCPEPSRLTESHSVENIPEKKGRKGVACKQDRAEEYNY